MKKINAGTEIKVKYIVGETINNVAKKLDNGNLYFIKDAYVQGETCKDGFYHLRQAREILPKKLGNNVKYWPRLRKACHLANVKLINIPGGEFPVHYQDEIIVPDFSVNGSHYFIINKKDIGKLLELVPLDETGKQKKKEVEEQKQKEWEQQQYQKYAPSAIAEKIGYYFWYEENYLNLPKEIEFIKFSFESWGNKMKSIIFCKMTDIIHGGWMNVPKIETNLGFSLSGWSAGKIEPKNHDRIKTRYSEGWKRNTAYLKPASDSADVVTDCYRWLGVFDSDSYESEISKELITISKNITIEFYDITDRLIDKKVYYMPDLLKKLK